jgi:DNA-binding response OmpR family regulator
MILMSINIFQAPIKPMKILVVDDEKKIADILAERLRLRGFDAIPVYDGKSGINRLLSETFDGVILDLRLPDIDGVQVLRLMKARSPDIKIVILSGHATEKDFKTCRDLGAIACFQKPANISRLTRAFTDHQTITR